MTFAVEFDFHQKQERETSLDRVADKPGGGFYYWIDLESEPGLGTTVRLRFPVSGPTAGRLHV